MTQPSITASQRAEFDLKAVLATEEGKRVLWRIVTLCGVWQRTPTVNGIQQWHEGRRDIGVTLMEDIQRINPNLIPLMMQAHLNEELEHEQRNRGR